MLDQQTLAMNNAKAGFYAPLVMQQIPRLLGSLDREVSSKSYGSFDRDYWAWKFRDFPITMLQMGVYPLALVWRREFTDNPYYQNLNLLAWIEATISKILSSQHKNGAFDSVGPNTQDHGVTLAMVYLLTEVSDLVSDGFAPILHERIMNSVRQACNFALNSQEDYAFINNHQALFALSYLNAAGLLGESGLRKHAEDVIERILAAQSKEGWYSEYGGPDPGYESLGIFYLARYWQKTRQISVLESLKRCIAFYLYCIHPDGSIGGIYGSRQTSLYFPGGFEILSATVPMAGAVASFMRSRLDRNNVLTPLTVDSENLAPLAYTYLEGCLNDSIFQESDSPTLPCESLDGPAVFPESGLAFWGTPVYYAVFNLKKGGIGRVFKKDGGIAYEDSGYLLRTSANLLTSQQIGFSRQVRDEEENVLASRADFAQVRQDLLTPGKFVVLRLLNLTLFKILWVGRWARKRIVSALITRRAKAPVQLTRRIRFQIDQIEIEDMLVLLRKTNIRSVSLETKFTALHMGSAKYFHSNELSGSPVPDTSGMADELNHSGQSFRKFNPLGISK